MITGIGADHYYSFVAAPRDTGVGFDLYRALPQFHEAAFIEDVMSRKGVEVAIQAMGGTPFSVWKPLNIDTE